MQVLAALLISNPWFRIANMDSDSQERLGSLETGWAPQPKPMVGEFCRLEEDLILSYSWA